jgi:hypothetical protein
MKFKDTIALGIIVLVGTVPFSLLARAETSGSYPYVSKVNIAEGHRLRINVPGNFPRVPGEESCNQAYAVSQHDLSDDRARAQLQIALASFLARKAVFIVTIGCQHGGNDDGYLLLDTIQLQQD